MQLWREFFEAQIEVAEAEQKGLPTEGPENVCKSASERSFCSKLEWEGRVISTMRVGLDQRL